MPSPKPAVIPAAPRKTLLEWIACDDGDTTGLARPACSIQAETFYAQIGPPGAGSDRSQPLPLPSGLRLAPLG